MCDDCHADCCRLPVEVNIAEFQNMGLADSEEFLEGPGPLVKRLKKEGIIRLFDRKSQMATLTQCADGSCLFLDSHRRCQIYDKRPETCRNFPNIGPRPGHCPWNKRKS